MNKNKNIIFFIIIIYNIRERSVESILLFIDQFKSFKNINNNNKSVELDNQVSNNLLNGDEL